MLFCTTQLLNMAILHKNEHLYYMLFDRGKNLQFLLAYVEWVISHLNSLSKLSYKRKGMAVSLRGVVAWGCFSCLFSNMYAREIKVEGSNNSEISESRFTNVIKKYQQ
jgi:hypothetical protein